MDVRKIINWRFIIGMLVVGCALGCVSLVMLGKAREKEVGRRASCKAHLAAIGIGLSAYATDNGGSYPPSLGVLYPKYVEQPACFVCFSQLGSERLPSGFQPGNDTSYVYLPGRSVSTPGHYVIAYDSINNHRGSGINVLENDHSVRWVPKEKIAELMAAITKQEETVRSVQR